MKKNCLILLACLAGSFLAPMTTYAGGGGPNCIGITCGGKKTYWTNEQRAAVEQRGFGGIWNAMGERERDLFSPVYSAGSWATQNILNPAGQAAFGPWTQKNVWEPMDALPPDIGPGPFDNIGMVGAISFGKWGRSMVRILPKLPRRDLSRTVDVLINQNALQLAKRKAQVAAGERTVTYWRVQSKRARDAIVDSATGAVKITPGWSRRHGKPAYYPQPLFVSRGGPEHAEHFAALRKSQGLDVEVVSFEVPEWFDDFVVGEAIPQNAARTNPRYDPRLFVKVVDETTPGEAFEFGKWWRTWFGEIAIPGSGLIHEVQ